MFGEETLIDEIVGDVGKARHAGGVVGDAVAAVAIGADIDPDDAAPAAGRQAPMRRVVAVIVEAEAVDDGFIALEAEEPRPRIAGLRARRHRADLDETEAEPEQRIRRLGVLVEAGGKAERIGEIEAEHAAASDADRRAAPDAGTRPVAIARSARPWARSGSSAKRKGRSRA